MTVMNSPISLADQRHHLIHGVSWDFYSQVLEAIGDGATRVTFSDASIEIMPPLPIHEHGKKAIGSLIDILAVERGIEMACFGSTTFRREDQEKGLEPDDCFYVENAARVLGMAVFDPDIYPSPDLAIEIDVTRWSIPRQPIYAALGVPELWRYQGGKLTVLPLAADGNYRPSPVSKAFPFLPMDVFESFIHRMETEMRTTVLREFQAWVRTIAD